MHLLFFVFVVPILAIYTAPLVAAWALWQRRMK